MIVGSLCSAAQGIQMAQASIMRAKRTISALDPYLRRLDLIGYRALNNIVRVLKGATLGMGALAKSRPRMNAKIPGRREPSFSSRSGEIFRKGGELYTKA